MTVMYTNKHECQGTSLRPMEAASVRFCKAKRCTHRLQGLLWTLLILLMAATPAWAGETVTYMYTNAQGTVVAEADAQGNVTYMAVYRPYGKQQIGVPQAEPGYTGHVNDPDTGLVYMQARYYDPETGRFLSVDPVTPAPGNFFNFNRYDYANNNPIRNTDPDGRDAVMITSANGHKTLIIPIKITGPAASSVSAQSISSGANKLQAPSGVTVRVVVTNKAIHGVLNTVTMTSGGNSKVCGSAGSCTNALGGNHAYVDSKRWDRNGVILHESGHMAGMTDKYYTIEISKDETMTVSYPGYVNNIMSDTTARHIKQSQIDETKHNRSTKECKESKDGTVSC